MSNIFEKNFTLVHRVALPLIFLHLIFQVDYSLLVGFDMEKKQLVVGIIDYMRKYSYSEILENGTCQRGVLRMFGVYVRMYVVSQ
jgi:hypothetical protein